VKRKVDRYFGITGRSPRDCPQMYVKTGVVLAWAAASYLLLLLVVSQWWLAIPLAISLGLALAAIGFNIQHDGGHRAYSDHKLVNRIMAAAIDLIGGSSYLWDHKHNTIHHTFPNVDGQDDDVAFGPLARVAPSQRRLKFHRIQQWYVWLLYGLLAIKWQLVDDFWNVAIGRIGPHRVARPKGWDLVQFIGGKLFFFGIAFVLPMMLHSVWIALLFYVIVSWVNGLTLAIVFTLAHVVEEAEFPLPDPVTNRLPTHWAVHQVQTTVDFARRNCLLSWYLGGLNFQIEHHLFPKVCHVHYPRISELVRRTCEEFGLRYAEHRSFFAGIASHYRWLRRMGRPVA
jgi:linoleoyl-CoA desaturase